MWRIIFFLSFLFLLTAFIGSPSFLISNPFLSFFFFQVNFLFSFFFFFFIGFLVLFLFIAREEHKHIQHISVGILAHSFFQVLSILIVSLFFACIGLFCIAWVHLNTYSLLFRINPSFLGININTKTILQNLAKDPTPPTILASDTSTKRQLVAIAKAGVGTNLYSSSILPAIPDFLIFPTRQISSTLLLVDNSLIVNVLNTHDLSLVSPVLGHIFLDEYFPNRALKVYPKISVMTGSEFTSYQESDAKEKEKKVVVDIQKMEDSISSFSATIQKDNDAIAQNQTLSDTSMKQRNSEYDSCLSEGTYTNGVFIPKFTKADCQPILDRWDVTLTKDSAIADSLTQQLQKDQNQLKMYQYYDNFFKAQETLLQITNTSIPDERGVFIPDNTIHIALETHDSQAVADYLEILCHEYLHYASYISGKRFDSAFFEEGMTEYFARRVIEETMHISTAIAYPAQVKIISAMTDRIAEPDLADMYFSKNEVGLEQALNLAYGDNFYKDNFVYFESLMYTSDPREATKITNTILEHMGEKTLSQKELYGE